MQPHPAQGQGGAQDIEQLLQPDLRPVGKGGLPLPFPQMQVVHRDGSRLHHLTCQGEGRRPVPGIPAIDEGRHQPLQDHGIALQQQLQGLHQIPAVDVVDRVRRILDDIARRIEAQIVGQRADMDEAAVIVAVR